MDYILFSGFITTLLRIATSAQSNEDTFCPSKDWIYCGKNGDYCYIEPTIKSTTISYGVNKNGIGKFVFWDLTNTGSNTFKFKCSGSYFGDPYDTTHTGCCYRNNFNQQIYNATNDAIWTKIAAYNDPFHTDGLAYIRYGGNGQYWYRWMQGEFLCGGIHFPPIDNLEMKFLFCSKYNLVNETVYGQSTFVGCGSTNGGVCNTRVVPNGNSVSLIEFGGGPNTEDQWLLNYAYSTDQEVLCNQGLFPDFDGQFCNIHNGTIFPGGVVGSWVLADSCSGCLSISESIQQGTTSTSSESTTTEWSASLASTVQAGITFKGVGVQTTLTATVSTSVSNSISSSYSQSVSYTCSATCGNNTNDDWKIWQWQMNAQEYVGADIKTFAIYACYYQCNTESNAPKCPPNYCADFACQTCKPY